MPRSDILRPSREVIVNGCTYVLAINGNAWATYEEVMKGGSFYDSLYRLLDAFRRARKEDIDETKLEPDEKKKLLAERVFNVLKEIPMREFRALVFSTLSDHHPELDLKQVGRLLDLETMWPFMMALAGVQSEDAPTTDEVDAIGSKGGESVADPTVQDQGPVLVELPGA